LSYAYLEVAPESAKAILRARQNTILGRGKRARAVTVTHSTQSDLMREIFPGWGGHFLGSKPCVVGMTNSDISLAIRSGLLSPKEVEDVLSLVRKPDSHFVKVPSLPYHHLASILRKFPADNDSKVLHTSVIKKTLIELVQVAVEELRVRASKEEGFAIPAMMLLSAAVSSCKVLNGEQRLQLLSLFRNPSAAKDSAEVCGEDSSDIEPAQAEVFDDAPARHDLFDILADTHKIDSRTVRALTKDFLEQLTSGNHSPASGSPVPVLKELPPAWFSQL